MNQNSKVRQLLKLYLKITLAAAIGFGCIVTDAFAGITSPNHLPETVAKLITGTVASAEGELLSGVTVVIQGTTTGTMTDGKGQFSIEAKDNDILVFSIVGYNISKVAVSNSSQVNVVMAKGNNSLDEVVVTSLGIKRESRSIGYSAQKVSGDEVLKADAPNISQGLLGKVAGLNITIPNGVEGSSSRIVIRGNNNLFGNNQPLVVVDGVMVDNEPMLPNGKNQSTTNLLTAGQTDVSSNQTDYGSFLNTINPEDVETYNLLKGPTAAALYGARGANGVLLIVTKKGNKRRGLGIDYNLSARANDPYRFVKMQNEYGSGMTNTLYSANPAFLKDGSGNDRQFTENDQYGPDYGNIPGGTAFYNYIGFPGDGASWGTKIAGQPLVWWDGVTRPNTANTNIYKSFFRTGSTMTNNVSFSGGGDVGSLRVSYTRMDNSAIVYNSNIKQNTFNIGSNINISKKLKVEANVSYNNLVRLNPDIQQVSYITQYHLPVDYKPLERSQTYNADGSQNTNTANNSPYPSGGVGSYWWNQYNNNTTFTQNQILGSVKLIADILPWLNATAHIGANYYTNQFEVKVKPTDAAGIKGKYSNDLATVTTVNMDALITAHKTDIFKDFDASLSGGISSYYNNLYDLAASNPGPFNYPFSYNLANYAGATNSYPRPAENRSETKINSILGILNISYKKFLYLEASGRNDWSSTLPSDNWSFFYPSATLSFVFTDAFKMQRASSWLSFGKIRIGEASSANGYVPYQTIFNYMQKTLGGFQTGLAVPNALPSLKIAPQHSRSFEIGTDLGFLNNRINLNFTYYNTYSYDQILPIPISTSSGVDAVTINSGALRNQGVEMVLNVKAVATQSFSWDITLNAAHNKNKVVSLQPGITELPLGTWYGSNGVNMTVKVGDNYGGIYGRDYVYLNGKPVVNLIYGDGFNTGTGTVIGAQYAVSDKYIKIGDATPKVTGGIANNFVYKNFSLYVLTDFNIGGQIWSGDYSTLMGQGQLPETTRERDGHGLPFVFPDGTSGNVGVILPGVTPDGKTNTMVVNSWWKYAGNFQSWDNVPIVRSNAVFNNSWGKLREAALTYHLSNQFVQKTKIFQRLSVSLIGRDLFYLFTNLPDRINPESLNGTTNVQGIQAFGLPGVRSYGFTLKAGF